MRILHALRSSAVKIHPTAVVSPMARLGQDIEIGPFSIVEPDVAIGDGCKLEGRVVIKNGVTLGCHNHVFEGAVIGGMPQHLNAPERPGRVVIGRGNTLRENVTVHRALEEDEATTIGDSNLLMVNVHIAHDCRLGNHTIFTNNAMLAGHVTVDDRAYISGAVAVHQFCRIGSLAMVGGQAHIVKDVPPYITIDGLSSCAVGVNQIGLRRAGFPIDDVRQIKAAYRVVYRSGLGWNETLAKLKADFTEGPAARFYQFLSTTTRGVTVERRLPPDATVKFRSKPDEVRQLRIKAS